MHLVDINSQLILLYISPIFIFGLIFFVLNKIITTNNKTRRGGINLMVGGIILIVFVIGYLFDTLVFKLKIDIPYLLFGITIFLYTVLIGLINIVKGKKLGMTFKNNFVNSKRVTPDKIRQFIYIIYKYQDIIYLTKKNNNYYGICKELKGKYIFKDELINILSKDLDFTEEDIYEIGKATKNLKIPYIYDCYIIELNNKIEDGLLNKLDLININQLEVANVPMEYLDKQIILRILIREKFNIILKNDLK